jgi:hypothetical protein
MDLALASKPAPVMQGGSPLGRFTAQANATMRNATNAAGNFATSSMNPVSQAGRERFGGGLIAGARRFGESMSMKMEDAASNPIAKLLMPELQDIDKKYLVVLRIALYILAIVLVLDWKSWGMMPALIALSVIAAVLAMAYVKSYNGVSIMDFKTPEMIAKRGLYTAAHYGSLLFLLVPVVHLVFEPNTIGRIVIALLLLGFVVALLRLGRAASER